MDFHRANNIDIRATSDEWGPFSFDFSNITDRIGETISSVDVKGYEGIVRPKDTTAPTEITSFVESSPQISGDSVLIRLQYPGSDYKNSKATLIITLTMSGGGIHPFYYHHVNIR